MKEFVPFLIGGIATIVTGFGVYFLARRQTRISLRRDELLRVVQGLRTDVDLFSEKSVEWWKLPADDPQLPDRRCYLRHRSGRLGAEISRIHGEYLCFGEAVIELGRLRDACMLGPFELNARPVDLTRADDIYSRANELCEALSRGFRSARF